MNGVICSRCGTPMIRSCRDEVEEIGDAMFITKVILNECPMCTAEVIVRMPLLPSEYLGGRA